MNLTIELTEADMLDIICAFDGREVLLRQNARETDIPHLKRMFLEDAEESNKNKRKWIAIRNAAYGYKG